MQEQGKLAINSSTANICVWAHALRVDARAVRSQVRVPASSPYCGVCLCMSPCLRADVHQILSVFVIRVLWCVPCGQKFYITVLS